MKDYATALGEDSFAIFLFHGVIKKQRHEVRNYTKKHIEADRFSSLLRDLCAVGAPVSLNDVVSANQKHERLPARSFAVTFDDGFENNYSVAAPILKDYGVPATFYITTGFIDSNGASWIDTIEAAVEHSEVVDLNTPFQRLSGAYATPHQKRELLDQIRTLVKSNPAVDPYEFAKDFVNKLESKSPPYDPDLDEKMNWEQVRELSQEALFTIGGHGHTHRILEYLDDEELRNEISTSFERLSLNLSTPIEHYSYPEGLTHCYSDRVVRFLRERGILCAPSAEPGVNKIGDDLFHLKRILVT